MQASKKCEQKFVRYSSDTVNLDEEYRFKIWKNSGAQITAGNDNVNAALSSGVHLFYLLWRALSDKSYNVQDPTLLAKIALAGIRILPYEPELGRKIVEYLADNLNETEESASGFAKTQGEFGFLNLDSEFGLYDASSLWLILLSKYADWTADFDLVRQLWPKIQSVLNVLDSRSANDGYIWEASANVLDANGFECLDQKSEKTLKVSGVSPSKIARCVSQNYLYEARVRMSGLAYQLGHAYLAAFLRTQSAELKSNFLKDFWLPEQNIPALAIDDNGRFAVYRNTKAMLCYRNGILDEEKAALLSERFVNEKSNSIQMLTNSAPDLELSYNCFLSADSLSVIISKAFRASHILQMISTCINFEPDAKNRTLMITNPRLIEWFQSLTIQNLRMVNSAVDLSFYACDNGMTDCKVIRKSSRIRVVFES